MRKDIVEIFLAALFLPFLFAGMVVGTACGSLFWGFQRAWFFVTRVR